MNANKVMGGFNLQHTK